MAIELLDHRTLARLVQAGAIRSVLVVAQPGGWTVLVRFGMAEAMLIAERSRQPRSFVRLETLVRYLRGLGIARFELDATNHEPHQGNITRRRPDRAAVLRKAHAAIKAP